VDSYFPVTKSFLSNDGLAREIEVAYGLLSVRCQLITASMRDVYLVTANERRYILFIYRHNQHTRDEIEAEWRFVDYLNANGVPVAPAISMKSGECVLTFPAPEGIRYGVLTTFVEGKHLRQRPSLEAARAYGRIVAQIHVVSDAMPDTLSRPAHDVDLWLRRSIAAFVVEVPERAADIAYLHQCAAALRSKINELPKEKPRYGMIHGDVIRANAQVADDGQVTILDFDLCGPGWRAYDIASYLIAIRGAPEEAGSERAFLSGYQEVRSLTQVEQEAIPLFEAARAIFSIGVPAMNIYHWGSAYFHAFLDHSLERLKRSMEKVI
jgi:Ser/Thr protein kinase RdoA (MazF antagonist)